MTSSVETAARVLLAAIAVAATAVAARSQEVHEPEGWTELAREAMGTTFSVRLRVTTPGDRAAAEGALGEVERLDRVLSTWREASYVSHLNRTAHLGPVRLDVELRSWIEQSLRLHADTAGAFDVTVGPLVRAWGFHGGEGRVPEAPELARLSAVVGSRHLHLDVGASTLLFSRPGVELDFGAIGKGWAVDAAVDVLRAHGIESALVQGGTSTVFAMGAPPDHAAGWRVSIRHPRAAGERLGEVVLRDVALSVSGDTERFFVGDGVRYSHVLDPRSCRPVRGVAMTAVLAKTAAVSDALSTAFFVLKEGGTREYLRAHPDVRALLCLEDDSGELRIVRLGIPENPLTSEDHEPPVAFF